jgi:hypothetical protein
VLNVGRQDHWNLLAIRGSHCPKVRDGWPRGHRIGHGNDNGRTGAKVIVTVVVLDAVEQFFFPPGLSRTRFTKVYFFLHNTVLDQTASTLRVHGVFNLGEYVLDSSFAALGLELL